MPQETPDSEAAPNWPKRIRRRDKRARATVYRKIVYCPLYRVYSRANGPRRMKGHPTYSVAKKVANDLAAKRIITSNSQLSLHLCKGIDSFFEVLSGVGG